MKSNTLVFSILGAAVVYMAVVLGVFFLAVTPSRQEIHPLDLQPVKVFKLDPKP